MLDKIYFVAYKIPHLKLRTQLINSSEAIAPLLAEGFAKRRNRKEMLRFYEMAMAESDEVIAHLEKALILSQRLSVVPANDCQNLALAYKSLSKQINAMIQKLKTG
jgi:four helix bundle protein